MRVGIVMYDFEGAWIVQKIARRLHEELRALGVDAVVVPRPDPAADVNHHLVYVDFDGTRRTIDTVMVTHVDDVASLRLLRRQLEVGTTGICMSRDTRQRLVEAGLPAQRLGYLHQAHDGMIRPRPLLVGIATRLYGDGRKREGMLLRLADRISPEEFRFGIVGSGWDRIVHEMRERGFTVDYQPAFELESYRGMIRSLDYLLYFGLDEGSMAFVDALAAGVPTIATPQGMHLDAPGGLTHPFTSLDELAAVFEQIARPRRERVASVAGWTWERYARGHLAIWECLAAGRPIPTAPLDETHLAGGGTGSLARGRARLSFLSGLARVSLERTLRDVSQRIRRQPRDAVRP